MLQTFGPVPDRNEIFVPNEPLQLRNNCQVGQWVLDGDFVGKKISFFIVCYRQFFGDLGATKNTLWGELFCYPYDTETVPPCLFRTFIKSVGLKNFNSLITRLLASGKNPANGVFYPEFTAASGQNDKGEPVNYFYLSWQWGEAEPGGDRAATLEKLAAAIKGHEFPLPTDGNLILLPSDSKGRDEAIAQFKASNAKQLQPAK